MARILLLYYHRASYPMRQTIEERIYAFRGCGDVLFANAAFALPAFLFRETFDLVIFETTLLAQLRWSDASYEAWVAPFRPLKRLSGKKVLLPQDEFLRGNDVNRFIEEFAIDTIFSVAPPALWETLYPSVARGQTAIHTILTGYLSNSTHCRFDAARRCDISYRAWRAEPWVGSHGILKTAIADTFNSATRSSGLTVDISTDPRDTLLGSDWYRFLLNSKYTIGVEGGSSLYDADGSLRQAVNAYTSRHPTATFSEVEAACFPGRDGEIALYALSPRHLEACATRTCQILVEGDYNGILEADVHYIPLKRDFSNIDAIIDEVRDDRRRAAITERAWDAIVGSGLYTYQRYASIVVEKSLPYHPTHPPPPLRYRWQHLRERLLWLWVAAEATVWQLLKAYLPGRFTQKLRSLKKR